MQYGFVLPQGDAAVAADLAAEAEAAGWDGFFVCEPVWGIDAWVSLTAAAMRTSRIRLGTILSPLSRMRPWTFAGQSATLDRLSGGRVIVSVGLGATDTGFAEFGEETDRKIRAELLDEALTIVEGLWRGQPFSFTGKHYTVRETTFMLPPPPVQQPRIPIWVVGAWPRPKSMQRALRYDGILPHAIDASGRGGQASPDQVREIAAHVREHRGAAPYDIIVEGQTPGDDPSAAAAILQPWIDAGATWWTETMWMLPQDAAAVDKLRARIRQGPPRVA